MLIELKGINKTYNNGQPLHVLKGIDLAIERGEFVSIMGASGSGKSTPAPASPPSSISWASWTITTPANTGWTASSSRT